MNQQQLSSPERNRHRKRSDTAARPAVDAAHDVDAARDVDAAHDVDLQLRTALEFSRVAIWLWTQSTDTIVWSGPVKLIYGKPESEITSFARFRQMVHPDDLPELEAKVFECLSSGTEYCAEFRIILPDGAIRWLAGRGDVLRDSQGLIGGISGANFDITAAKLSEHQLKEGERSFRELADAMPQMVWTTDTRGRHDYFNRRWFEYTGGSDCSDVFRFIHPDDFEHIGLAWRNALETESCLRHETESSFHYELRLRRASDHSYRWHLARAIPVRDENGMTVRWYGTFTDVEDFKQAQIQVELLNADLERRVLERSAELAESELRYRLLVDGVKDYAILLLDPEGRVKSWNKGAELLTGYQAAEILGQNFSTFYSAASKAAGEPRQSLEQAAQEGRSYHEGWRVRRNGEQFWASALTTALRDPNAALCGFSKVIRDMTKQRRSEELLILERKRAESANRAKSAFLASMSHEIRTPMNAILGMADLLWESDLSPPQRHYVEIFRRAGGNLLTLINDILDLSKIESGNFSLEKTAFSVPLLVEQVVEILQSKAESKSIELRAEIAGCAGMATVVGDPARLQQVLLNLIGNAIKFTSKGEVLVRVECRAEADLAGLEFAISDTGIGIPADKLECIFEDFEQAESSTTRRFGGTGLGLGISRRLVGKMGGQIKVQSEFGKGSTFSFHVALPFGAKPETAAAAKSPAAPPVGESLGVARRFRILAAEDSEDNQFLIQAYCQERPFDLTFVEDGRQAVAAFETGSFDLILMDVQMPVLDGLAATRQIRAMEHSDSGWHIPILALTANALSEDISRARSAGCDAYLSKPISKRDFLIGVEPWLLRLAARVSTS